MHNIKHHLRLLAVIVLLPLAMLHAADRPNIIVVLVDDMRFDQMSNVGHPYIETPTLDAMAKEGMSLNRLYCNTPLCGPNRACLYSGRHTPQTGRLDNGVYPDSWDMYLPTAFKDAGYTTALLGKSYERISDDLERESYDYTVLNGGPDWSKYSGPAGDKQARSEFYDNNTYIDQNYHVNGKTMVIEGHQTNILFDHLAEFTTKQGSKPFFAIINPFAPHTPLNPSEANAGKHAGKGIPPRPNQEWDVGTMKNPKNRESITEVHEKTCEMIQDVDTALGRLIQQLKDNGQWENTILMFSSDNGSMHGEHGCWWKRQHWEECIKVPLIVTWPGKVAAGSTSDALIMMSDLLITCADAGQVELPADPKRHGESFLPVLLGNSAVHREHVVALQLAKDKPNPLSWAVLIDRDLNKYTWHVDKTPQREDLGPIFLNDLTEDPYEMNNLIDTKADLAARMRGTLKQELNKLELANDL